MNIALGVMTVLLVAWMIYQRRGNTTPAEARRLVSTGARLVDVRSRGEYASGHIDGAINVPLDELSGRMKDVGKDKEKPVVLYCLSGARSARAASILKGAGYTQVHNLGSMSRW